MKGSSETRFAEILPYFGFEDGVLITSDGSVSVGLRVEGTDVQCASDGDLSRICGDLRTMMDSLEEGCDLQVVFECGGRKDAGEVLADYVRTADLRRPFAVSLAEARATHLTCAEPFRSRIHIFCRIPPKRASRDSLLARLASPEDPLRSVPERRGRAERAAQVASSLLRSSRCKTTLLTDGEIEAYLYEILQPSRSEKLPWRGINDCVLEEGAEATLRSRVCMAGLTVARDHLFFDGIYARAITLKTLPESTFAGIILPLLNGLRSGKPLRYRLTVRAQVADQGREIAANQIKRNVAGVFLGLSGRQRNLQAEASHEAAEGALEEMLKKGQRIYRVSMVLLLLAPTLKELSEATDEALLALRQAGGAEGMVEEYGQEEALLGSLPGTSAPLVRPFRLLSNNIGDLLPVFERWRGSKKAGTLFQNDLGGLVRWDLFDREMLENYNALVVGASGMGKSFTVSFLTQSYAARGCPVWFVDVGGSYRRMIEGFDGAYIPLDLTTSINPFGAPGEVLRGDGSFVEERLVEMAAILERMAVEEGRMGLSHVERTAVDAALRELYKGARREAPILSDFVTVLRESIGSHEAAGGVVIQLVQRLTYWTDGPFAAVVNRRTNVSPRSAVVGFDLKGIEGEGRAVVLLILSTFLRNLVEHTAGPKIVVFDECWSLLSAGARILETLYRTGRKHNACVMSVTQSFSDFLSCPIAPAILANSAVRYILPLREGHELLAQHLHLNPREEFLLKRLRQEKGRFSEIFAQFGGHHTVLRLSPSPLEYWTATTHPPDLEREREVREEMSGASHIEILKTLAERWPQGAIS